MFTVIGGFAVFMVGLQLAENVVEFIKKAQQPQSVSEEERINVIEQELNNMVSVVK